MDSAQPRELSGPDPEDNEELESLRKEIIENLRKQGFKLDRKNKLRPIQNLTKEMVRDLNRSAVNHQILKSKDLIRRREDHFIERYIASGADLDVASVRPKLVEIVDEGEEAELFRWVKLHWSIPTSSGYGRRLRYLVIDETNDRLMGIIGLGDPVFGLKDRDQFIGWDKAARSKGLRHVMDAFILGSVPPYSQILGGKMVAILVSSKEVRERFKTKYHGSKSVISGIETDGTLAAITTASALGKSAMYDRLKMPGGSEFLHAGWTAGSGEFPFINGTYNKMKELSLEKNYTGKNKNWGSGIRNRRSVVRKALREVGLSDDLLYHGIKREIFVIPMGSNWKGYLCGTDEELVGYDKTVQEISAHVVDRWMLPRSERDLGFRSFCSDSYRLRPGLNDLLAAPGKPIKS